MIKCGHCQESHATVAEVKACSGITLAVYGNGPTRSVSRAAGPVVAVDIEAVEREMHRMEAEGDRAEARRDAAAKVAKWQAEEDRNPATASALHELRELLETKETPEHERRYAQAVKEMLGRRPNGYAVRSAIARISAWRNVRAGGYPDDRPWSSADRERAQVARTSSTGPTQEGLYKLSRVVRLGAVELPVGQLVQVVRSKESNRLYAKQIVFRADRKRPELRYVAGLIFKVLDSELCPAEEAQELTRQTGWCIFGHFLTNPESIARGMGPVCYERYPHLAKNHDAA